MEGIELQRSERKKQIKENNIGREGHTGEREIERILAYITKVGGIDTLSRPSF